MDDHLSKGRHIETMVVEARKHGLRSFIFVHLSPLCNIHTLSHESDTARRLYTRSLDQAQHAMATSYIGTIALVALTDSYCDKTIYLVRQPESPSPAREQQCPYQA